MAEATPKPLERAIEHPCAPCAYGEHERCLDPIGDDGNCCCDALDGWAPAEPTSRTTMPPHRREALRILASRRQR